MLKRHSSFFPSNLLHKLYYRFNFFKINQVLKRLSICFQKHFRHVPLKWTLFQGFSPPMETVCFENTYPAFEVFCRLVLRISYIVFIVSWKGRRLYDRRVKTVKLKPVQMIFHCCSSIFFFFFNLHDLLNHLCYSVAERESRLYSVTRGDFCRAETIKPLSHSLTAGN